MGQVTIYLEDEVVAKMKAAAEALHISQSKWIASLIKEKIADEWPESVRKLAGAWSDFPCVEEIRAEQATDIRREEF